MYDFNQKKIIYWIKFILLWSYLVMVLYWLLITEGDLVTALFKPLFFYYKFIIFIIEVLKNLKIFLILKFSFIDTVSKEAGFIIGCYLFLITFIFLYLFLLNQDDFDLVLNMLLKRYPWLPNVERYSWYILLSYIFFLFIKNSF